MSKSRLREIRRISEKRTFFNTFHTCPRGGDRTRVSIDDIALICIDLHQRTKRFVALWLQSPVSDEHDFARIVTLAQACFSLPEAIKREIEAMIQNNSDH